MSFSLKAVSFTQINKIFSYLREGYKRESSQIEGEFNILAEQWYRETLHSSGYVEVILHPAYQRIIGLGKDVVPFILRELQDEPLEWFWALRALTGEDPTTAEMTGKRDEMAKAWLDWGKEQGFI